MLSHLLHAGLPVKIVQFVGVGLQVVEFPNVYVVVEVSLPILTFVVETGFINLL